MEQSEPEQKPHELKLDGALWLFLSLDEQHDLKKGKFYETENYSGDSRSAKKREIV